MESQSADFWLFLAGLALFLLGMSQMEHGFREMAGPTFRRFLQGFTNKPWKGIIAGTVTTAILQSSSLVTLMVLAFLGAGLINLGSAISVILGANLGTTMTAWIVALLGFKISVSAFAYPFIGIGTLTYLTFSKRPILSFLGLIVLGFGMLFFGLDLMKTAIEDLSERVNFSQLANYGNWVFLLTGIILTALIQSSSATLVILLSAIHAGVIGIEAGAAVIIGANIGTTVTISLGAFRGKPDKKRLAISHIVFNLTTGLIFLPFVNPCIHLIQSLLPDSGELIQLVFFNTFFNATGILIFYPFLPKLEKWLMKNFQATEENSPTEYIQKADPEIPQVALEALRKENLELWEKVQDFILLIVKGTRSSDGQKESIWARLIRESRHLDVKYAHLKEIEEEITRFNLQLQKKIKDDESASLYASYTLTTRLLIYAAKNFKDILHNLKELENSEDPVAEFVLKEVRTKVTHIFSQVNEALEKEDALKAIEAQFHGLKKWQKQLTEKVYEQMEKKSPEVQISTLIHIEEQVFQGLKNIGAAVVHMQHPISQVLDFQTQENGNGS